MTVFFDIQKNTLAPTRRRISKIFNYAIIVESIMLITIAVIPYFALRNYTPNLIILRDDLPNQPNYLLRFGKFIYALELGLSIPVVFCPARNLLSKVLLGTNFKNLTYHSVMTVLFLGISTCISICYPKVISILSLISGSVCIILTIVIPSLSYIKSHPELKIWKFATLVSYSCFVTLVGFSSVVYNLYKIINPDI